MPIGWASCQGRALLCPCPSGAQSCVGSGGTGRLPCSFTWLPSCSALLMLQCQQASRAFLSTVLSHTRPPRVGGSPSLWFASPSSVAVGGMGTVSSHSLSPVDLTASACSHQACCTSALPLPSSHTLPLVAPPASCSPFCVNALD